MPAKLEIPPLAMLDCLCCVASAGGAAAVVPKKRLTVEAGKRAAAAAVTAAVAPQAAAPLLLPAELAFSAATYLMVPTYIILAFFPRSKLVSSRRSSNSCRI
jgi:hypothetical protein